MMLNITGEDTLSGENITLPQGHIESEIDNLQSHPGRIVSNELINMIEIVVNRFLISLIAYIGVIGNIISIIIFRKQGSAETINISLTAIAAWDLIKCITGAVQRWHAIINNFDPVLGYSLSKSAVPLLSYTSVFCTYVSAVLAGYVAVERCLCVSLPFNVKYLLTPKLVFSIMIFLSIFVFGSFIVVYFMYERAWVFHPGFKEMVIEASLSALFRNNPAVFTYFNVIGFIWPSLSLTVICISTLVISYHLRKSHKFRSSNTESLREDQHKYRSARDRKVIKMLLVVLLVYISTIIPRLALNILKNVIPGFYIARRYSNLYRSCMYFEFMFDFLNASANSFIFYSMSSQYKATFKEMFGCFRVRAHET